MGQIPTGAIAVAQKQATKGKSDHKAYCGTYTVKKADGTEGGDFERFKKHCSIFPQIDPRYPERVRDGQMDGGTLRANVWALLDAIENGTVEVSVVEAKPEAKKGKGQ